MFRKKKNYFADVLTKKNRYAFHALIHLANADSGPQTIAEIAKAKGIPKKFLEVILLELKRNGILGSKMGKGGGYYLRKKANEVKLAEIIRLIDGPIALLPCVSLNYYEKCTDCPEDEDTCSLKKTMEQVRDETLKVLENKTLTDFMQK